MTLTAPDTDIDPSRSTTSASLRPDDRDVLAAAHDLAPDLSARAAEGDQRRSLPDDLVERMRSARLFEMLVPRALGGLELDLPTLVEVIEVLSQADGSAGWTTLIGNSTSFFAWLEPAVAAGLIGATSRPISTSMFAPYGQATDDGAGTLTVNGRWPFNSGVVHADWCQVGVMVMDGERPRLRTDGRPDWRFAFFPRDRATVIDTWDSLGLRGTGSHDIEVSELCVPAEHTAMPMFDPPRQEGPLWRLSFWTLISSLMAGFPLGIGRRALDELTTLAMTKRRGSSTTTIAEDHHVQVELGRAEAGLQAARAFVVDAVADCWTTVLAGDAPSEAQDGRVLLSAQQAMRAGLDAVDLAFRTSGAGAALTSHPGQRCFRDLHTASLHLAFADDRLAGYAQTRLGIEPPTFAPAGRPR